MKTAKHVVIIPDGNRRWAKEKGLPAFKGHEAGSKRVQDLVDFVKESEIEYLTFWGFSTENWKRAKDENTKLIGMVKKSLRKNFEQFMEDRINFRHIGRKDRLDDELLGLFDELESKNVNDPLMTVILAFDYGGRDELVRAYQRLAEQNIPADEISEEIISQNLDTYGIPDPDLVIRTSGEIRLSGILPWQSVYAEYYFTDKYFPDFDKEAFELALNEFAARNRRFGGN